MAEVEIRTERVDDVPLLVYQQSRMGMPEILDRVIRVHGNREGLSIGWLTTAWLAYVLSEADHRMWEVETWAESRLETLSAIIPQTVRVKDFTDDRLADVLDALGDDEAWETLESQLGQHLVRVYDLKSGPIRLDSTTAAVYQDAQENTLFRHGHSKDHRPDLAQLKVMLATLDPLGMPLATLVVPGNEADDGLYLPAVRRAQQVVGKGGRLYVGDAKMASLATRAGLQASGDYYLTPLPQTGEVPTLLRRLLEPVWKREQALERIGPETRDRVQAAGSGSADAALAAKSESRASKAGGAVLALGFEVNRSEQAQVDDRAVAWQERVLVVYSPMLAKKARRGLAKRLERAEQRLLALTPPRGKGQRQTDDLTTLQAAAEAILKKQQVEGLLAVSYVHEVEERLVRKYRERPAHTERCQRYVVQVVRNQEVIAGVRRVMGWRLYASNAPTSEVSLAQAVWVYRGAPRIERDFHRLKGHPLGLRPLYVEREEHVRGMVHLLSLALRVLTVTEHVVREGLKRTGETLTGLYPGNPKQQTVRPTSERLLKAFGELTLTVVRLPEQAIRHVTALSPLQRRILTLLSLPASIYEDLAPPPNPIPP